MCYGSSLGLATAFGSYPAPSHLRMVVRPSGPRCVTRPGAPAPGRRVRAYRRALSTEDLLDRLDSFFGEFGHHIQRVHVLMHLLDSAGASDNGAHVGV